MQFKRSKDYKAENGNQTKPKEQNSEYIRRDQVYTESHKDAYNQDSDNNGVPDYLQREPLLAISQNIAETNLAEVDAQTEKEEIVMKWRGYMYNPSSGMFEPTAPPMMTESAIMQISQILDSHVNKVSMTTEISEEMFYKEIIDIMNVLNAWLADNKIRWQIKFSDLQPISSQCEELIANTLRKSINDKQRQHVTNRTRITESKSSVPSVQM